MICVMWIYIRIKVYCQISSITLLCPVRALHKQLKLNIDSVYSENCVCTNYILQLNVIQSGIDDPLIMKVFSGLEAETNMKCL